MSDFRATLYETYVTRFKGADPKETEAGRRSFFDWCQYRILPFLQGVPSDGKVLELGCGPGYFLEFLSSRGFRHVQGIDICDEQVALAVRRGNDATSADVFQYLEETDQAFSAIVALDFLEHFHRQELVSLLQSIFRALDDGGRLILRTPNGGGLFAGHIVYGDLTHLTIFTPNSLTQLLRNVGFESIEFRETGPVPRNLLGRLRMMGWRSVRWLANCMHRIETGMSQPIWTQNLLCCCRKPRD